MSTEEPQTAKQISQAIKSTQKRRGSVWRSMNSKFSKDPYTVERQADANFLASDYTTVFLPWGPKWNAENVQELMERKDFILNNNFDYNPEKTSDHTHPCFFGTINEVLGDCCGSCPNEPDDSTPYVHGRIKWRNINPGAQAKIGSFNPITEGDWTEGTYTGAQSQKLCVAVNNNNMAEVKTMISEGADVDGQDLLGRSPLIIAALSNSVDSTTVLIENNPKTTPVFNNETSLDIAAKNGHTEVAKLITELMAKFKSENMGSSSINITIAMHYAVFFGHDDVITLLVKKGAHVNTLFSISAPTKVPRGRRRGTEIETPPQTLSSLELAAYGGHDHMFKLLLDLGADVNQLNSKSLSVLHTLVELERIECVRMLLASKGFNLINYHVNLKTALHKAVRTRNKELVQLLIDNGAKVNITKQDLLLQSSNVNINDHFSPVIFETVGYISGLGAAYIDLDMANLLLDNGADESNSMGRL